MLTAFPTPVLSIAADAVKDLEGRDALLGLWSCMFLLRSIIHMLIYISTPQVFAKCKESLQDGRRLENISWRLWYREMMRDGVTNRLYQGNVDEKEEQDQDANRLDDLTLSDRRTVSPQDHDHAS
jgi:hypothetical protein